MQRTRLVTAPMAPLIGYFAGGLASQRRSISDSVLKTLNTIPNALRGMWSWLTQTAHKITHAAHSVFHLPVEAWHGFHRTFIHGIQHIHDVYHRIWSWLTGIAHKIVGAAKYLWYLPAKVWLDIRHAVGHGIHYINDLCHRVWLGLFLAAKIFGIVLLTSVALGLLAVLSYKLYEAWRLVQQRKEIKRLQELEQERLRLEEEQRAEAERFWQRYEQRERAQRESEERARAQRDEQQRRRRSQQKREEEQKQRRQDYSEKQAQLEHRCRILRQWIVRCDDILASGKRAALTEPPLLPIWICDECKPGATGKLAQVPCCHTVKEVFRQAFPGHGPAYTDAIRKERTRWHPDRFGRCSDEFKKKFAPVVTEMSKIFNGLFEGQ